MYLKLFLTFVEIGALSFGGGYASLPLIQDYIVNKRGRLTLTEMTDVVTISQLTPGPIAINAASFVGTKVGGPLGAVVATAGSILPQSILMIFLGHLLFRGKRLVILDRMLKALRPGVVGLIGSAALAMTVSSAYPGGLSGGIDIIALVGFVVGFIFYRKNMDMTKLIGLGAGLGLGLGFLEYFL